jgi:hypothetical protein
MIRFVFEDKSYEVGQEVYDKDTRIVLPDNRVLEVGAWQETVPVKPGDLTVLNELPLGSTPEETAKLVSGSVAREVESISR